MDAPIRERARASHDASALREERARATYETAAAIAESAEEARIKQHLSDAYQLRTREAEALSHAYDEMDSALTLARRATTLALEVPCPSHVEAMVMGFAIGLFLGGLFMMLMH